jgi:hypothetical protein
MARVASQWKNIASAVAAAVTTLRILADIVSPVRPRSRLNNCAPSCDSSS